MHAHFSRVGALENFLSFLSVNTATAYQSAAATSEAENAAILMVKFFMELMLTPKLWCDRRFRINLPHSSETKKRGYIRAEFWEGDETATFQFSESGGSVNGPDLFTESPFLYKSLPNLSFTELPPLLH